MGDIIKEILSNLPEGKISAAVFEGANIVLYTKDIDFFLDNKGTIKEVVDKVKKRIELRPDPSCTLDPEKAEKEIRKIMPEEAGTGNIIFDPQRSQVIIEVDKPGVAIGKNGELLRDIKEKTRWVPLIRRMPAIRSLLIENIRAVLYQNSDYRRKFLDRIGHRIYDGWIRGRKKEWIRVTYLGGARQVGRSCILVQTPESRVLLDCGINVAGDPETMYPHLEVPEFKIEELDAIIVSHAHLDHSGLVPYLFKFGYRGPVYCTEATRDLMALLQLDFIKIQQSEGKDPIYTAEDVKEMVKHTVCLNYEEVSDITPDFRITLYNSGHILGSSMIHLHIGNGLHNILYTGDLKFGKTQLFDPAATVFPRLETLMIESTYGGKDNIMPPVKEEEEEFRNKIIETIKRGGKVLMPVLGSGRAQDMMIILEEMIRTGKIEKIPIYIDGMVWDIMAIHTAYPEFLNSNMRKMIFHKDENPFLSDVFKKIGSQKERQQVIESEGSCIILATSGMLVGGPSVQYLKALADNPKNCIIFTCFQPEGSLGYRIRAGEKTFTFTEGKKTEVVEIKMEVHKMEITDHADRNQLMNFVYKCDPRPKKIIINHGESSRCLDLASSMHRQYRVETICPRNLETVRLK
ncbi:MAG: beta-CASP ribonuclease aCPSF1 [Candidatus Woesearchaeota archaeon]